MHFYNKVHHVLMIIFKGLSYQSGPHGPHPRDPRVAGQEKILGPRAMARGLHSVVVTRFSRQELIGYQPVNLYNFGGFIQSS